MIFNHDCITHENHLWITSHVAKKTGKAVYIIFQEKQDSYKQLEQQSMSNELILNKIYLWSEICPCLWNKFWNQFRVDLKNARMCDN